MSNQVVPINNRVATSVAFGDMERLAEAVARSGMFGLKTKEEALTLMAISQAEGRHPALAARDYDIIQGRPAKKSESMMRDFIEAGGKVEWHALDDKKADATFSHPAGGTVRITWDMERAKQAGLLTKDMYRKFPRQMLRSRVVSEGVRTVCPAATSGMYVPEEIVDFDNRPLTAPEPAKTALPTPRVVEVPHDPETGEISPHAIPVPATPDGTGADWITWGSGLIAALKAAASRQEGEEWITANNAALTNCKGAAPRAHTSIQRAIGMMRERLPQAPVIEAEPDYVEQDDAEGIMSV